MDFKLFLILFNLITFIVLINYPENGNKMIRLAILMLLIFVDLLIFIIIKIYKFINTLEKFYYKHICEDDEKINDFLDKDEYENLNFVNENDEN